MSQLTKDDARFHYTDMSHRWTAPPDVKQETWDEMVQAHLAKHRTMGDGPAVASGRLDRAAFREVRQRNARPS